MNFRKILLSFIILGTSFTSMEARPKIPAKANPATYRQEVRKLDSLVRDRFSGVRIGDSLRVVRISKAQGNRYDFHFNRTFSEYPFIEGDAAWVLNTFQNLVRGKVKIRSIYCGEDLLSTLDTAPLGNTGKSNSFRTPFKAERSPMVVRDLAQDYISMGLNGRHIALWASHGWYHENKVDEWRWQRPLLFGTVEDLLSQGMVLDYLTPMLENAGANVFMPRERGTQNNVVTVEDTQEMTEICFEIPEEGAYPVYITYCRPASETPAEEFEVSIAGSRFAVNPNMAFDMPVWIGEFFFEKGWNSMNISRAGHVKNVRIGSGLGRSGMPRWCEGSRYWLEDFGADSSIFMGTMFYTGKSPADTLEKREYTDDYMSRGLWTQNLSYGSRINPERELPSDNRGRHLRDGGKKVPVDLSLALHSDAGIPRSDSTYIGTLAIYTLKCDDKTTMPNGESRILCREVCGQIQSQIVEDLRQAYDEAFVRRGIWNRSYSESRTTATSAMLLEGFSHQSFPDMVLANDPKARFIYCRAIYKGILKYISNHYGCDYEVTPLGIRNFSAILGDVSGDEVEVHLSWEDIFDPLEPTARASGYIVYERSGTNGNFRELTRTSSHEFTDRIPLGELRSYKVAAYNRGGKSFDGECLAAGMPLRRDTLGVAIDLRDSLVRVVNNFTRIAPPAYFVSPDRAGFDHMTDEGVPYGRDITYTGMMYDFDRASRYENNVYSGHGASFGGNAGNPVAGNTFDFTASHARAAFIAGYPVESMSVAAYLKNNGVPHAWVTDIICGKQAKTALNINEREEWLFETIPSKLRHAIDTAGNVILSGSYIASDAWTQIYPIQVDSLTRAEEISYLRDSLGIRRPIWRGTISMKVIPTQHKLLEIEPFALYSSIGPKHYSLQRTDAFVPAKEAKTLLLYEDSTLPAAVLFKNKVTFAFPLECITSPEALDGLMKETLKLFK